LESAVFDRCNLIDANFVGADISGVNFNTSKVERTLLDVEGFILFGNSKGFVLEQMQR
jgi:uncharacterized protein YjbI with pentapeptide repeats